MSIQSKRRVISILKAFNYIGLIVLLFLTFTILAQIKSQAVENNKDNARFAERIEKDHDLQNKYLECLVNLFIEAKEDVVTPEQSALCLAQVREQPKPTEPTIDIATPAESPRSTPAAPQTAPTIETNSPTVTTSEPPDPPEQSSQSFEQSQPSIVEQLTNRKGIL